MVLLPLLFLFTYAVDVNETEFNREIVCGDGRWDSYNEECDSTAGCGNDCLCIEGYNPDGKGHCIISCMYGDACVTGCLAPDICEVCDESLGYTADCQGCNDTYMWYGEGKCKEVQIDKVKGCGDVFTSSSDTSQYEIKLEFTSAMKQIKKEIVPAAPEQLYINRCTRYVHPTKPYTYGQYLKVTLPAGQENTYISIAIDKQYNRDDLVLAQLQEQKEGSEFGIIIQEDCISGTNLRDKVNCLYRNGGLSEYILSPRVVTWMNADSTQYIFVHKKYASSPMTKFQIFFTKVKHPCSNNYYDIDWNDIAGDGYSRIVNLEHTLNSRSICSKDLIKGFWFRIKGAEQTIVISTCQSENYDVSLDLLQTKTDTSTAEAGSINCESPDSVECVKSRSDGCGTNSKLAKMVVTLSEDNTYYLFLGINEEYSAEVLLTVNTTCPLSCGENGICSAYSGRCECKPGFVFKDDGCTECGNGVVDANEDCDLSSGVNDTQCTESCNCAYGTKPMSLSYNGKTEIKCAVPTCGNGKIDEYEECDGGYGCDHCVCVDGTKKYAKARLGCIPATCGNKKWDEGEECDGGDGCIECECQEDWFENEQADCTRISKAMKNFLFWGIGACVYLFIYIVGFIISLLLFFRLTKKIKQEIEDEKMTIFENTVIPFDKTNSQFIDIKTKNDYFSFSSNVIEFPDLRPEINDPVETKIVLTNNWKQPLHFTFHSGDYTKYEIMCKPFTGTIRPGDYVELNITFMAKCTTLLNEKVPITLRYGQLGNILKDIKRENPDLIAQNSQSSQNSESEGGRSLSSNNNANSSSKQLSSNGQKSHPSKSLASGSAKSKSDSEASTKKKKKGKSKISKFHVYLNLQVESALSTKLDYEEIHLQHPPIGGGTFGIVYRADWRRVDVAVKVMKTDLVGLAELLPNFSQEAEMMERIRCPYIVNFIGSVTTPDTLCLVTEFCPLGSLRKFMKTNPLTDILKVRFCQDIARGMEYLHQNDILHRDLKTDNVLVYSKNPHDPITAKVTDFGTSRSFIESSGKIALQNIGTPVYMAPEISRKDQMTLKSDVYSFAICMLEIWLGRDPYDPAKFPDSDSILRFVGAGKRLDISDDCLLKDVIEQSWRHNPSERPTFKEIGVMLDSKFKIVNDKSKSDSHRDQSASTKTETRSKELSSERVSTTNTTEESIEASVSSQVPETGVEND
ncbi:hypothetical protein ENUP19_0367G0019 [Entamoeba nuttalli]|uniref:Protein kinase domain-containing protein n=1 Tax=Entamoeba nuttalli TaxID=412467 RepID=A0ABQ0DYT8_9EUKA